MVSDNVMLGAILIAAFGGFIFGRITGALPDPTLKPYEPPDAPMPDYPSRKESVHRK